MLDRARWSLCMFVIASLCLIGCGEDKSADTSPAGDDPAPPAQADAGTGDAESTEGTSDAGTPVAQKPRNTIPTPDVPVPPGTADQDVTRAGWISFSAAQKPAPLAQFYEKTLKAKGWELGRNESKTLGGTTNLAGVVQEYTKGSELLTVVLTQQIASEGDLTMGVVMDTPVPADSTQLVAFANQATIETPQPPDASIAALTKRLVDLGWKSNAPRESAGTKSVGFTKGNRTLSVSARATPKKGSSMQIMHIAYAG